MNVNVLLMRSLPYQKGKGKKKRHKDKSTDVIPTSSLQKSDSHTKSCRVNITTLTKRKKKRNTETLSSLYQSKKYQERSISEFSTRLQRTICNEMYKGKFFNHKNCDNSYGIKKRLIRRIVEKRILQYVHSFSGSGKGMVAKYISHKYMRNTINHIVYDCFF